MAGDYTNIDSWKTKGNCHGLATGFFYPDEKRNKAVAEAKAVCVGCVVKSECLEHALTNGEHFGVWGGMSERERRRERRKRKIAVAAASA